MAESRGPEPSRARRLLSRSRSMARPRTGKQWLLVGAGILLVVTAPFGGLRAQAAAQPPTLRVGRAVDIGPFDVTVNSVVTLADLRPSPDADPVAEPGIPGDRLFLIDVTVRNTTDQPQYSFLVSQAFSGTGTGVVALPGEKVPTGRMYDVADSSGVDQVNPGVSYEFAVVFEQRAGWQPGKVRLGLSGYTFQEKDPLGLNPDRWVLADQVAEGPVPVRVTP